MVLLAFGGGVWWFAAWLKRDRASDRDSETAELIKVDSGERPLMGTLASITLYAQEEEKGRVAIEAAFERAREINSICSDYDPESELMRLCRAPINQPISVSETLATVLAHARTTAEITEGSFDPTLGALTKLWRDSRDLKELPDPVLLDSARKAAGWEKFEVDLENHFVVIKHEHLLLDLGGIAKGYAADEMLQVLRQHGVRSALIAVGDDIRLGARPPDRAGWTVGIKTLGAHLEQIIQVSNCAVSTSGDINQHVEIAGQRYSHIIDPRTGLGLTQRIAATVVAPNAVQSDPLATFCCVDPGRALKIFTAGEISCRIVGLKRGAFDQKTQQFPPFVLPESTELIKVESGERPLMGTLASITLYAQDEENGRAAIDAAFERAREINSICSDYDPESELMRLCRAPINQPIPVSQTLATVLTHARSTAEITEGAFDPTLGALTKLWRKSRRQKKLPDPVLLESGRRAAGWEKFEVELENGFVIIKHEDLLFDLGGIAKGYAADEMLQVIKQHGIRSALVAVAGDIRLGAPPPHKTGWTVGIKTLGAHLEQIIQVANCAVSTSGDINQHVEIDGQRYSHIIDPKTGLGLTQRIAATVVAPNAVQSDPLATFCCVNPRLALEYFAAGEISCRIVGLKRGAFDQKTQQFPPFVLP